MIVLEHEQGAWDGSWSITVRALANDILMEGAAFEVKLTLRDEDTRELRTLTDVYVEGVVDNKLLLDIHPPVDIDWIIRMVVVG